MRYLNAQDLMAALSFEGVMEAVEEALRLYESKQFVMPDRMSIDCGDGNLFLLMPSVAADRIATKLVTVYPGNRARGRPVIDGIVVLSDRATGEVLALMDGKTITAMRTGAVTGVSIRYLARPDARTAGLVGCGVQGYYQVMYACTAREIERIALFDVNPAAMPPMIDKLRAALPGVTIKAGSSAAEVLAASEIVIAATTARAPIFPDDPALFAGKHLVAIGSFEPEVREYPDAAMRAVGKVWIDTDFALEESGELIIPLRKGLLREEQLETLGHFILSGRPPERGAHGTTMFKTVGMALFDLTTARQAYASARERNLGTEL
jgi:ornithine cyclodeaminase/alanine dehydrogenase-like protein (mu-crystallin family)